MFGRDEKVSPVRLTAVQYMILAIFMILAYGLWRLQVVQSDMYASLAEKNRVRNVPILAPRGKILDREGRIIVDNYPSFTALLLRDSSRDLLADADLISQGLHLDPNEVRQHGFERRIGLARLAKCLALRWREHGVSDVEDVGRARERLDVDADLSAASHGACDEGGRVREVEDELAGWVEAGATVRVQDERERLGGGFEVAPQHGPREGVRHEVFMAVGLEAKPCVPRALVR